MNPGERPPEANFFVIYIWQDTQKCITHFAGPPGERLFYVFSVLVMSKSAKKKNPKQSRTVVFRMSEEEHVALKAAAIASGQTTSSFLRNLALEGAGVKPFFSDEDLNILKALVYETRKTGVNINQIARAINSRRTVHPEEIRLQLDNVSNLQRMHIRLLESYSKRGRNANVESEA